MDKPPDSSSPEIICPECEYNLEGLTSDRCPWCGWTIDVQELVAGNLSRRTGHRLSIAGAAIFVGACSTVGLLSLYSHSRALGWRDALAVVSVFAVAIGHFGLAITALRPGVHWPMREGEASNILRLVGWGSIAAAVVSATPLLSAAPHPLIVKGVQVNGVLEFVVTAIFFSLPGVMLLILRLVSYRHPMRKTRVAASSGATAPDHPFLVEVDRSYAPAQLMQEWVEIPRMSSPTVEEMIARTWEVESALAQDGARTLYNGQIGRLTGIVSSDSNLTLKLGPTNYRDFLGTNLFHAADVSRLGGRLLADPLGISGLVLTRDGFVVLGVRGRKVVFHAGHVHTFGGLLENADRAPAGYDLIGSLRRELNEEMGLVEPDITSVTVTGLVRDRLILQPELIFDVLTRLSRAELVARFDPVSDLEHTEWIFVADDPDALVEFLRKKRSITAVAKAALLLHGKHAWGTTWYEQANYTLFGGLPGAGLRADGERVPHGGNDHLTVTR